MGAFRIHADSGDNPLPAPVPGCDEEQGIDEAQMTVLLSRIPLFMALLELPKGDKLAS